MASSGRFSWRWQSAILNGSPHPGVGPVRPRAGALSSAAPCVGREERKLYLAPVPEGSHAAARRCHDATLCAWRLGQGERVSPQREAGTGRLVGLVLGRRSRFHKRPCGRAADRAGGPPRLVPNDAHPFGLSTGDFFVAPVIRCVLVYPLGERLFPHLPRRPSGGWT